MDLDMSIRDLWLIHDHLVLKAYHTFRYLNRQGFYHSKLLISLLLWVVGLTNIGPKTLRKPNRKWRFQTKT